jgi:hypothetical protein
MTAHLMGAGEIDAVSREKLAARVFLILHDPFTGKPQLRQTAVRLAVAGAELAELTLSRPDRGQIIALENDRVVLAEAQPHRIDYISSFVIDSIRSQREAHPAMVWTAALADHVFDLVATQLINERIVQRRHAGRLFTRPSPRFPAVDLLAAAGPRVRLEHALRAGEELDEETAVCLAVLAAVGGDRTLDVDRSTRRHRIASITDSLPLDLRGLITGIEVAHASGELSQTIRLRTSDS